MKFNENRSKGSGHMEPTQKCYQQKDRQDDGQTDKGYSYNPPSWWVINKQNLKLMVILYEIYETSKSLFHLLNDHECKILFLLLIKYNVYLKQDQTLLWTCMVGAHLHLNWSNNMNLSCG